MCDNDIYFQKLLFSTCTTCAGLAPRLGHSIRPRAPLLVLFPKVADERHLISKFVGL
jgi:hypothetical protein